MVVDLQKADLWKRIAAWLLDIMLLAVLAVGVGFLLSAILNYDGHYQKYETKYDYYMAEYDLKDVDLLNPADEQEQARCDAASAAMRVDTELIRLENLLSNLMLIIVTFSLLITIVLLEFVAPLLFGNGQTVGKKLFALGLIRTDSVKIGNFQLFVRAVFGKFTIETMIPAYVALMTLFGRVTLAGMILVVALGLIQMICVMASSTNSAIHDFLAGTIVVDISSQQVFKTPQELIAYTKRIHAEEANRKEY